MPRVPDDHGPESTKPPSAGRSDPVILPYVLDRFEQGDQPDDVRHHLVALGYTADEAGRLVEAALAVRRQSPARESAWLEHEAPARRCMSAGFGLLVLGISVGFLRAIAAPANPTVAAAMGVVFWGALGLGMVAFFVGVAQLNIRRR